MTPMNSTSLQRVAIELARELVERDVEIPLKTAGLSMGATIRDGDSILVQRTKPDSLNAGDIVVWQTDSGLTAHRILYKQPCGDFFRLTTKGDSCLAPDPPVSSKEIIGRVAEIRGPGGTTRLLSTRARVTTACLLGYGRFVAAIGRAAGGRGGPRKSRTARLARKILLLPAVAMGRIARHRLPNCRS